MKLDIRPLTADLWLALEDLFGKHGACNGCWCMYWRIGAAYRKRPSEKNKAAFKRIVKNGPPPGLLAFDGDVAVGWCQLTPRSALPALVVDILFLRADRVPQAWRYFRINRRSNKSGISSWPKPIESPLGPAH